MCNAPPPLIGITRSRRGAGDARRHWMIKLISAITMILLAACNQPSEAPANNPPMQPEFSTSDTQNVGTGLHLSWTATDLNGDPLTFIVYAARCSSANQVLIDSLVPVAVTKETFVDVSGLQFETQYAVRVAATDGRDTTLSQVRYFITGSLLVGAWDLINISDGAGNSFAGSGLDISLRLRLFGDHTYYIKMEFNGEVDSANGTWATYSDLLILRDESESTDTMQYSIAGNAMRWSITYDGTSEAFVYDWIRASGKLKNKESATEFSAVAGIRGDDLPPAKRTSREEGARRWPHNIWPRFRQTKN